MRFKLFILTLLTAIGLNSQNQPDINSNLKARYIFNFANMIEWPSAVGKGSFNIGLLGEPSNLLTELNKYNSKSVGSQSIKIIPFSESSLVTACHILFITREQADKTAALVKKFKANGTLIISEKEGALKDGSIINFIIRNNRQTYELSKTNASKHKLIIGKQLTELAAKVE